jgi:Outer membrane protein beta-barrel domain
MRKFLLLQTFGALIYFQGYAQENRISIGAQVGPNFSMLWGNDPMKRYLSGIVGFSVGGQIKYNLTNHWGLVASPSFEQTGGHAHIPGTIYFPASSFDPNTYNIPDYFNYTTKLGYIIMPIQAEYTIGVKVRFKINGGVYAGILTNKSDRHYFDPIVNKYSYYLVPVQRFEIENEYKTMNFGLSFGMGVQIPINKLILIDLTARDNLGLTNIYIKPSVGALRTNSLNLLAGVVLAMK